LVDPWIPFPTVLFAEDDDLGNSIMIDEYDGVFFSSTGFAFGRRIVTIDAGQQAYKINHNDILAGNSASLELENTNVDYLTSATAKVILIIRGSSPATSAFQIIEDTTPNSGAGILKEDFPSVSIGSTRYLTSKELSFSSGKYITVKVISGNIGGVTGFVIE